MAYTNVQTVAATSAGSTSITIGASGNDRLLVAVHLLIRTPPNTTNCVIDSVTGNAVDTIVSGSNSVGITYWLDSDLPSSDGAYAVTPNGSSTTSIHLFYAENAPQEAPTIESSTVNQDGNDNYITLIGADGDYYKVGGWVLPDPTFTALDGNHTNMLRSVHGAAINSGTSEEVGYTGNGAAAIVGFGVAFIEEPEATSGATGSATFAAISGDSYSAVVNAGAGHSSGASAASIQSALASALGAIADGVNAGDSWVGLVAALGDATDGAEAGETMTGTVQGAQTASMSAGASAGDVLNAMAAARASFSSGAESADDYVGRLIVSAVFSDGSQSSDAFVAAASALASAVNNANADDVYSAVASAIASMLATSVAASSMSYAAAIGYLKGITRLIAALDGVTTLQTAIDGITTIKPND